uniref:Uncharacterized protein n=1 Tax=Panagrolaimus davidi TaxID=227884 RepID=A0A914QZY1_9BILA
MGIVCENIDLLFASTMNAISKHSTTKKTILWPETPSIQQKHLSLPYLIIDYIAKNPLSPEVYKKLIQCCKYFFEKMPVLVAADMFDGGRTLCPYNGEKCDDNDEECCVSIDINKLKSSIWPTNLICLDQNYYPVYHKDYYSLLCSKIYLLGTSRLCLRGISILFDDFKILVSAVKNVELSNVDITYNDGKPVMLEGILESIPHIKTFELRFEADYTFVPLAKIMAQLKNLDSLTLKNIPEVLNVCDLSTFIKNHKNTKIWLSFADEISDGYKARLDALIDIIIETGFFDHVIQYDGQDQDKRDVLWERYHRND